MGQIFSITGQIVDVVSGTIFPGRINISSGKIESVEKFENSETVHILPGLIDAHIHIESSMLSPSEFARLAVVHGTTATVSDPHEIANVLGMEGVKFMVENGKQTPFKFNFGAPSCVPATGFESSGAILGSAEVEELLADNEILYLSEMMNFPGVVYKDEEVMAKLKAARDLGKPIDGHAPGLSGEMLEIYAKSGITTDHECVNIEEAEQKIALGMHILIREGSAARNFDNLIPLLKTHPDKVMFCSDDKHPDDLIKGHMNLLLKRSVEKGYNLMDAIRACTLNPVKHYRLKSGLLQPGDDADFIIVDSPKEFNILATYIRGEKYSENGVTTIPSVISTQPNRFNIGEIIPLMLKVPSKDGKIKVIHAYDGELVTGKMLVEPFVKNGFVESDIEKDILKITVINRFSPSTPAMGFIHGIGLKHGAIASTVAHDSHNLICVGTSDEYMMKAIELVSKTGGGIAFADENHEMILPLPIAGIMTDDDGNSVAKKYEIINDLVHQKGSKLRAPFMTLSFMALLVIPELKLSDKGLFDGNTFSFTDLFER
ncbi:MAG: adenine deaminase [Bacteroidales bacterium]|nr:adenine deaminase [Bacteroidales bacterium]